jgi:hypothetical protein
MGNSLSRETNSGLPSQEIPSALRNPKIHYRSIENTPFWESDSGLPSQKIIFPLSQQGNPYSRPDEVKFEIYLILPAALDREVYSASNKNKYRKH